MSILIIEIFQSYADFSIRITRLFLEKSYTVYIIHPVVVIGLTAAYIAIYRSVHFGNGIEYNDFTASSTILAGPEYGGSTLALGWITVNILSQMLLWPLAWLLKQLPGCH